MKKTVALGMSGGVDSSVSALLLKEQGYDVIGVTMNLLPDEDLYMEKKCSFKQSIDDAKSVADQLGIKHYVIDLKNEFNSKVVESFVREYSLGYTPNPCVTCNKYIKFDALIREIKKLGADFVATGHYAKSSYDENSKRFNLGKAKDAKKDQTYFLYNITQEALRDTLFPLADLTKEEVRDIGKKFDIVTYGKKDSEEICFIKNDDHGQFIKDRNPELIKEGNFIDEDGNVLGRHKGIIYYTLGQRKGLGIALGKRVFVSKINVKTGEVTLSNEDKLYKKYIEVVDYNLISIEDIVEPIIVNTKIRHGVNEYRAKVSKKDDRLLFEFEEPVRAPSKGQSAVMYDGDIIIGGGIIDDVY